MAPTHQLLLGLILLYLLECVIAVRRGGFLFWFWRVGRVRLTLAQQLPGSLRWGLFLRRPIPPFGQIYEVGFCPISLSISGISTQRAQAFAFEAGDALQPQSIAYDAIKNIRSDASALVVNGKALARFPSDCSANDAVKLIRRLIKCPARSRAGMIDEAIARSLDIGAAKQALSLVRGHQLRLRIAQYALLAVLFGVLPAFVLWTPMIDTWHIALGSVLVSWFHTLFQYWCAHRRIYPDRRKGRRKGLLVLAMTPLSAVRAHDLLCRPAIATFHPLVASRVLCDETKWMRFAQDVYRDLMYPLHCDRTDAESTSDKHCEWFRDRLRIACEVFLRQHEFDASVAGSAPQSPEAASSNYCPRCHTEYTRGGQLCEDCGVSLKPIVDRSAERETKGEGSGATPTNFVDTLPKDYVEG